MWCFPGFQALAGSEVIGRRFEWPRAGMQCNSHEGSRKRRTPNPPLSNR